MRRILNFLITALVLFLAGKFFPANVWTESFGWLMLTTLLIWVVSSAIALLFVIVTVAGIYYESAAWVIVSIIGILFSTTITILLLSKWLSGFHVSGFWTALLLSLVISIFSFRKPSETE